MVQENLEIGLKNSGTLAGPSLSNIGSLGGTSLMSDAISRNITQSINQNTNINVQDSGSPVATAKAIYNEQNRVNSDLIRNFAGAVR